MADLPEVHALRFEDHLLRCQVDTAHLSELLNRLAAAGIRSLVSQPPSLEELFLRYYDDAAPAAPRRSRKSPGPSGRAPALLQRPAGRR